MLSCKVPRRRDGRVDYREFAQRVVDSRRIPLPRGGVGVVVEEALAEVRRLIKLNEVAAWVVNR